MPYPCLPPEPLRCSLSAPALDTAQLRHGPPVEVGAAAEGLASRRALLRAAAVAPLVGGGALAQAGQLVFSPDAPPAQVPAAQERPLALGQIPADFWLRPRELWLTRRTTGESVRAVYWRDGKIQPEGYWRICALLRDVRANRMTHMDPVLLDVLRGILGYYHAWGWLQPLVITSGFRTAQTNRALGESAAKNSMHLHGRAVDLMMANIPARDIGVLALHFQRGGVGFYPSRGFTHIDTGRPRVWQR